MKVFTVFIVVSILLSCGESEMDKKTREQKHANAVTEMQMKKLDESNLKIQRRGEMKIAMMKAGVTEDSINQVIRNLEIKDSLELEKTYDTTTIIP